MTRFSRIAFAVLVWSAVTISMVGVMKSATPADTTQATANQNWLQPTGDLGNRRYSSLTQINTQTVKNLGAAWVSEKFDDAAAGRVTPTANNGVVFFSAGTKVYALDGKSGKTLWKYDVGAAPRRPGISLGPSSGGRGIPNTQGVTIYEGKVYVGLLNGEMLVLDEKTGTLVWRRFVSDGLPDQRAGVSAAPVIYNGVLYTSLTFDEGRYVGRAVAIDAKDGHELWTYKTVPGPGEPGHETWTKDPKSIVWTMGGANVWMPPVIDQDLGVVYYCTGNPSPNRIGIVRPGNNLYSSSVLSLDMKTGKMKWYFQATHHDMWEGDFANPIVLYDTEINGVARKGLGALRPDGTLFVLDRVTGKPLFPVEERAVRQNPLYATSPTQPFPVGHGSVIERDCSHWGKMNGFIVRCEFFNPPFDDPPNVISYAPTTRSSPMSYSPFTGYFYVQGVDKMNWQWNSPDPTSWEFGVSGYLSQHVPYIDKNSALVFAAVDPKTYKVVWRKEMRAPSSNYGVGGFLSTGGGLEFHRLEDGNFIAYDAKTGDELWKFQTGVAGTDTASPMSYEAGGQQYVAVIERAQLWAFRLGGTVPPAPAPELPALDDILKGPIQDANTVRVSAPNDYNYRHDISPLKARIQAGGEVTFLNSGAGVHTFVAEDGSWTTGTMLQRQTVSVTFAKPGNYLYHCKEHPWSYGLIIVTDANATTGNAAPANDAAPANGAAQVGRAGFAAQAARGKDAYLQQCSVCHQPDLGGSDMIPALAGSGFMTKWQGQTAKDLFDRTRTTMPAGSPGSLSPQTYADLVAYLLLMNSVPQPNAFTPETAGSITIH